MIQQQIDNFSRSLQNLATEYSDPSVIVQHIPVLKDNLMLQQNPEYLLYGLGGLLFSLFALKRLKKRRLARVKNVGMVMPQPYLGDADAPDTQDAMPPRDDIIPAPTHLDSIDVTEIPALAPKASDPLASRAPTQQLEDVSAISFTPRAALTPDEARLRVLVQAGLNEFGSGYMIMARTSLAAILEPGREAVGQERALALSAIQDKYIDFGVFDRTGRCIVALDVSTNEPAIGKKALDKTIVKQALDQAGLHLLALNVADKPALIRSKLAPFLKATARAAPAAAKAPRRAAAQSQTPQRPGRPTRPVRPLKSSAIAAE